MGSWATTRHRTSRVVGAVALGIVAAVLAACVPPPGSGPPPTGTRVQMDAGWTSGFFSLPWPNAIRTRADGTLDLTGLPTRGNVVLGQLAVAAGAEVDGAGTNAAVYLRFTGSIDPSTLPTPAGSTSPSSPVQLVALDGSAERVPVVARIEPSDGYRPSNLLSLLPYPGHGMRPATEYAVVLTNGLLDDAGEPVRPAGLISRLDRPFRPGDARSARHWSELRAQRDAARAVLAASGHWGEDDLVGFTVFGTQDSTALMDAVAAAVDRFDVEVPELTPVTGCDQPGGRRHFEGRLAVPRFQSGNTPATGGGGRITIGDDGAAVVRRVDHIGVGVNVPCGPTPEGGWAIQSYIDGTGAGVRTAGGFGRDASTTVIGSVAPLYSPDENGDFFNEILFYNFLNPPAARTNPIQQAADNLTLVRMLQRLELDGELVGSPSAVSTDGERVVVTGHSQGAQTVALVARVAPEVDGIVTSAATGGQYNSVSYRSDVRDIVAQVVGSRRGLDVRNPVVQVIQTLLDVDEPANHPTVGHWLNFAGRDDGCLTLEASRHLAGSQSLTVIDPQWPSLFGEPDLDPTTGTPPVSGNGPGGTTRASIEVAGGHRVAFGNTALIGGFIDAIARGETPVVPVGPYDRGPADSCAPREGEIGNHD